jgi:hypothetical protein
MNRCGPIVTAWAGTRSMSNSRVQTRRGARYAVIFAAACGLAGCRNSMELIEFEMVAATAYGRVTTADGKPVGGAVLHVRAFLTCDVQNESTWRAGDSDNLIAAADGSYRNLMRGPARGDPTTSYCVVVQVDARPTMGLGATSATTIARFVRMDQPPYDSVRVDATMR